MADDSGREREHDHGAGAAPPADDPATSPTPSTRRGPPLALQLPSLPLTGSALDLPSLLPDEPKTPGTPLPNPSLPTRTLPLPALRALAARRGDFTHFPSVSLTPAPGGGRHTVIHRAVPVAPGFVPSTTAGDTASAVDGTTLLFGADLAAALVIRLAEAGARPGSPLASSPRKVPEAWWAWGVPSIRAAALSALFGDEREQDEPMAALAWEGGEFGVLDGRGSRFAFAPAFGEAELVQIKAAVLEALGARAAAAQREESAHAADPFAASAHARAEFDVDNGFAGLGLPPPRSSAELLRTPPSPTKLASAATSPRTSGELLRSSAELLRSSAELLRSSADLPPATTAKLADSDDPDVSPTPAPHSPRQRRSTLGGISFLSLGAAVGIGRKKK
ncbi:hypothetical protein Q8F55_002786 [Vanrija albida]|uniref:Uncharacterized protein n=1 Tax=Vanrija albida TaxID=181172 RepID=A0ABR3QAR5_9TREE